MTTKNAMEVAKKLYYYPKPNRWQKGIGKELPEEYKKFWKEWKLTEPTAVHYIKETRKYVRNDETGEVKRVQNVPLILQRPKEINEGIWGGESVIQGFMKPKPSRYYHFRRYPKFWFPLLQRSILYSEVLDTYLRTIVTPRTLNLIHENYGFDHYLLKTPACDLNSLLALKIKQRILVALADKTLYPDNEAKKEEVYAEYSKYLDAYTREEIEWYGLSYREACIKFKKMHEEKNKIVPLKQVYRKIYLDQLRNEKNPDIRQDMTEVPEKKTSWLSKFKSFSKSSK
ncbi:large ribosomal subunit protein bL28m [Prorops nasuta]|uniref:large ribosomal subunit protein bL28m n=1 Tax=Prorops nasuta TaxID=863751 RepID=UPI0034CDD198